MLKALARCDPYQLLFPVGMLHGMVGAGVWVSHAFFHTAYPSGEHAHHMFSGFLLSFAAGFLLTAVPKFTGSRSASPREMGLALGLSLLALMMRSALFPLVMLVFIAVFALRRFKTRAYEPPPHFLFLPIGILFGILGSLFLFLASNEWISFRYIAYGRLLLYYGTMLAFILGIGAKLVTALLGWTPLPTHQIENFQRSGTKQRFPLRPYVLPALQAFVFVASFVIEGAGSEVIGRALRAGVATWIGFSYWRLHLLPKTQGRLPLWIWVAGWLLVVGLWTYALFPNLGVHAAHLFFMGGYGLMTLMIGSRVSLAHGGFPPEIEVRSPIFTATGIFIVIATLTRVLSVAMPESYTRHLGYAASSWIIALVIWGWFFIPKIFSRVDEGR